MIFNLSTSTPPSTLTLPCYQANPPSDFPAPPKNSWEDVANSSVKAAKEGMSQAVAERENLNSKAGLPVLDIPLPFFQEKPIYKRGKFKWATSFGQGPISHPPFSPSDAQLSEGDVFVWVDTASSPSSSDRVRVWCSFTTLSRSHLVWRQIRVLEDIRVIGDARYMLSLSKNVEPSWIEKCNRSTHGRQK